MEVADILVFKVMGWGLICISYKRRHGRWWEGYCVEGLCGWGDHKEEVAGLSGKVEGQSSCGEISRGQRFTGVKILWIIAAWIIIAHE